MLLSWTALCMLRRHGVGFLARLLGTASPNRTAPWSAGMLKVVDVRAGKKGSKGKAAPGGGGGGGPTGAKALQALLKPAGAEVGLGGGSGWD